MGQNQSLSAKGMLNLDGASSPTNHSSNQDHTPSHNPPPSSGSSGSNPSGSNAMELQTQSVRAAIDSFIETCLAGGPDKATSPPHRPVTERTTTNVEAVTVPEEENGNTHGVDESSASRKHEEAMTGGISSDRTVDCAPETKLSASTHVLTDSDSPKDPKDVKFAVDGTPAQGNGSTSAQNVDEKSNAVETGSVLSLNPTKSRSTCVPDENSAHSSPSCESNKSKDSSDGLNDGDGVASVRLKTIIERVLDNSLGVGMDLKSIPLEQQILPLLADDERATSLNANKTSETENSKVSATDGSKSTNEGGSDRKVEPMTLCFMDHIEKAVERSFSSITEEEERKEKEKVLAAAARAVENKMPSWNSRGSKTSEMPLPAPSIPDGTISVQDIVDRVISQTEVISKRGSDSKPLVAASGTFYPDRLVMI